MFVSAGGTIHIYKTPCDLKDLAMPKELAESGSLMLHDHLLFADWWGKNHTNKSHGGEHILPFVQQCQSSLETSYNYCPVVKTNIIILILKSEENRIKGLSQCHMESMKGASRNSLFTKVASSARLCQNAAAAPSDRVCPILLLVNLSRTQPSTQWKKYLMKLYAEH